LLGIASGLHGDHDRRTIEFLHRLKATLRNLDVNS